MNLPPQTIWRGIVDLSLELAALNQVDCIVAVEPSYRVVCWKVITDDLGNCSVQRVHDSNHCHRERITDAALLSFATTLAPRVEQDATHELEGGLPF